MQQITNAIQQFWNSKYNWTLVLIALFIYFVLSSTYSSNNNYDMVKDVYHYFIFTNIGILVASTIKRDDKSEHLSLFASVSLLIQIVTILSIKSYAIPGIFVNIFIPVSIFVFLYVLKEAVNSVR